MREEKHVTEKRVPREVQKTLAAMERGEDPRAPRGYCYAFTLKDHLARELHGPRDRMYEIDGEGNIVLFKTSKAGAQWMATQMPEAVWPALKIVIVSTNGVKETANRNGKGVRILAS
jgi:hypothetical protein